MNEHVQQKAQSAPAFKLISYDGNSLFQFVDLFPIPIEVFSPNGVSAFVNKAFLEYYNIPDSDMIVGKFNILSDPFANSEPGLVEYLQRIFAGEILTFPNIRVPYEEMYKRYKLYISRPSTSEIYQDIKSFPVWDRHGDIEYIIVMFQTRHVFREQDAIIKGKKQIELNWLEEFDMDMVADAVGLSRYHFSRLFKKHTGMTPYNYYQEYKLSKLKEALQNSNLSITQAFASCGVDYSGNFSKYFRDKVGLTPSQYRQAMISNRYSIENIQQNEDCINIFHGQEHNLGLPPLSIVGEKEELLFQMAQLFPIPIQIFKPDGDIIFINDAVLKMWNISDTNQILGKYNLIEDPFVNEKSGLSEYIRRTFRGEIVLVPDVKIPLEDFWVWYKTRSTDYDIESMYTDILNFPIYNEYRAITQIMCVFLTTRIYRGKSDMARAKEYMENHLLEEFDLNKISQAAHLSRYHFVRRFKKHTGMTPHRYYQELKINKLKEALRDRNLTVSEAFFSCGISYHGNFAKLFKKKVGMTPSQYRKIAKP